MTYTLIPLKLKYREGVQHKGIKRKKSDHQPGKVFKDVRGKLHTVPYNGKKYRHPRGMAGTPMGKPIRDTVREKKR